MVLRLCTKVLEDGLLPVTLHIIPVVDLTMTNGIADSIAWGLRIGECFIADEEIKILYTTL